MTIKTVCFLISIVLVENIPKDLPLSVDGTTHVPLSTGLNSLLDQAKLSVEVVSPVWNLNSWDQETWPNSDTQVSCNKNATSTSSSYSTSSSSSSSYIANYKTI
jgi:hypothetical protein